MADNYLITGYCGKNHVTAENDRGINAGIIGTGRFVLPVGKQFKAEHISGNTIRIYDGKLVDNGAAAGIPAGEYVDLTIANASQGMNRNDLIVFQYSQDHSTLIETGTFVVVRGVETSGAAVDPELQQDDLLSGDADFDQMPLWRIPVSTGTISAPEQLFKVAKSLDKAGTGGIVVDAISSDGAAYTATIEDLEELYNGLEITIIPNIASTTTAPTLNVNGLGAKPIRLSLSINNSMLVQPKKDEYYAAGRPIQLMFDSAYLKTGAWRVVNKQRPSAEDLYGVVPIENGGTGADNAEEALNNLGVTAMMMLMYASTVGFEVLWENASPTSSFGAQTVTVTGMENYSVIAVVCTCGVYLMRNNAIFQSMDHGRAFEGNHQKYTRNATPNGNAIEFTGCIYSATSGNTYQNDEVLIPVKVFGVRGWSV